MDKFTLFDLPKIDKASPSWIAVEKWANNELEMYRTKREDPDADLRKLDIALGSLLMAKKVLELPQQIQKAHESEPVEESSFGIPPLDTM